MYNVQDPIFHRFKFRKMGLLADPLCLLDSELPKIIIYENAKCNNQQKDLRVL